MPDSNITKRALAGALRELLEEQPFSKISVGEICERCQMARKSFYYHFRDKYDLVSWIYDVDFITAAKKTGFRGGWELVESLCACFYDNRSFYRRVLEIQGQDSFSDYLRNSMAATVFQELRDPQASEKQNDFRAGFYADAFVAAVKRWLSPKQCLPAGEFTALLEGCLGGLLTAQKPSGSEAEP